MNTLISNIRVWGLENSGKEQVLDWLHKYRCTTSDFSYPKIKMMDEGYDILVIRDISNWMADYVICYDGEGLDKYNPSYRDDPYANLIDSKKYLDIRYLFSLYHKHAEIFLKPPSKLITILFNKWIVDKEYRKSISYQLGFEFVDIKTDFTDMLYSWEKFTDSIAFWENFLNCKDTFQLSKKIFGGPKRKII